MTARRRTETRSEANGEAGRETGSRSVAGVPGGVPGAGTAAAEVVGLSAPEARPVAPYPGSRQRRLVLARKIAPTPERFPRRPGMAVKRPLGSR